MKLKQKLILAARGSLLSRAQVELVRKLLADCGVETEFLVVKTKGDKDRVRSLKEIGGDGLFVREVERALLDGSADVAVHCGKDLPYQLTDGLEIVCVPDAASAADCLIWPEGKEQKELRVIGSGSARRVMELQKLLPDAVCKEIRGNINTRIEKLRQGQYDAIVLAKAGLDRLNPDLSGLCVREFAPEEMIPAACQGILALECRSDDEAAREILDRINNAAAMRRFQAERKLFCRMKADCATALGMHASYTREENDGTAEEKLTLHAMFAGRQTVLCGRAEDTDSLIGQAVRDIYPQNKKCILAVSFGTSFADSREAAIGGIERALERAFPAWEVRRAFTSGFIIKKIFRETGVKTDTVTEALERAAADGIRELLVQPTHFMKGIEYDEMQAVLEQYRDRFERLTIAEPLLASEADFRTVAAAAAEGTKKRAAETAAAEAVQSIPDTGEKKHREMTDVETAFVFMGHGTSKANANTVYEKLQRTFTESGCADYYIATVEASPTILDVMKRMEGKRYRRVVLRPLMVVAGDHACNDMAGDADDAWKSILEKAGYEVTAVLHGLGEDPAIQKIYVSHTQEAINTAEQSAASDS